MPSTPSFSFSHLSPSSQLSMASHMSSSALIDFALASCAFHNFLTLNIEEIVLCCLRTQYGYLPDFSFLPKLPPLQSLYPPNTREQVLLESLPLLTFLVREEALSQLPEHQQLLTLLSSSTGTFLPKEEQELLYGPGVRGLLRYLIRYHSLRNILPPELCRRRMCAFLQHHYSAWGIHEIAGVYECLCDIVAQRLAGGGFHSEELEGVSAHLIAGLDVLQLPPTNSHAEAWILSHEKARKAEEGFNMREDYKRFFCEPAGDALKQILEGREMDCAIAPSVGDEENVSENEEEECEESENEEGGGEDGGIEMKFAVPMPLEREVRQRSRTRPDFLREDTGQAPGGRRGIMALSVLKVLRRL